MNSINEDEIWVLDQD